MPTEWTFKFECIATVCARVRYLPIGGICVYGWIMKWICNVSIQIPVINQLLFAVTCVFEADTFLDGVLVSW